MTALQPGEVFAGYTIERRLGVGGMGEVYVARHPRLPRSDALKVLAAGLADNDQFRRRFEREADVVAGLSHPHVVKIHDRGESDGRLWIAYDLVDGPDLSAPSDRSPRTPADVARVIREIAGALDAAAARGLVHRDVKPANILIDEHGRALLTDFGIARDANDDAVQLTGTGMTVGTLAFASPEQLQALPVDARSDQYSLACTAFTLLTGTTPYTSSSPTAAMLAHLEDPIPSARARNSGLPPAVDQAFFRGLAKDPAGRFTSSSEFAAALENSLVGDRPQPVPARAPHPASHSPAPLSPQYAPTQLQTPPAAPRETKRRRAVVLGIAALVVIAAVAATLIAVLGGDDEPAPTTATADVSVDPAAEALERVPVSKNLPSLASKPGTPLWEWAPPKGDSIRDSALMGGTDRYVLYMGVTTSFADGPDFFLQYYIVDAETGKLVHQVSVPHDDHVSLNHCQAFATGQKLACEIDRGNSVMTIVDLEAGTVSKPFPTLGSGIAHWAVSGDVVVANSKKEVAAYDSTGRRLWRAANRYPETISVSASAPVRESPVVEVRDGDVFTLRSVRDGKIVFRQNLAEDLGTASDGTLPWQPFRDGFAVLDGSQTVFYDATGRRTSAVPGWLPAQFDDPFGANVWRVSSLPMVVNATAVGAVDPIGGTVLWERPIERARHTTRFLGGLGTQAAFLVPGERVDPDTLVVDCYTAAAVLAPMSVKTGGIVTDGTRAAIASSEGVETLHVFANDGEKWQLDAATNSALDDTRFMAIGDRLYQGTRRIL